ncbi:DUF4328 domain-containing protein [Myceligenerans crystallogenes]|uniref:DUF4328 domain-containing protein n=1 Tax=Myceligenerans crystallogenes TaxID=316335 RepID=A0ABN2NAF1_9MICO
MISLIVLLPANPVFSRSGFEPVDPADLDLARGALQLWGYVQLADQAALVAAWIATGIWLVSARSFALATARDARISLGAPWAVLGWVVPVVAFWFPYRMVNDVWKASVTDRTARPRYPVGPWWGAWLLTAVLWGLQVYLLPGTLESGGGSLVPLEVVISFFMLLALWRWWQVVDGIQEAQREAARWIR